VQLSIFLLEQSAQTAIFLSWASAALLLRRCCCISNYALPAITLSLREKKQGNVSGMDAHWVSNQAQGRGAQNSPFSNVISDWWLDMPVVSCLTSMSCFSVSLSVVIVHQ
jgi:hypothetical protein